MSAAERRGIHESWLLAKVFQDLMRGIRASLEEAYFFTELLAAGQIRAKSSSTLEEILAPYRAKAGAMKFPPLLAAVNARLEKPLEFTDAYQSMQAARNCLEHRNGVVSRFDAGSAGVMELRFPRLKIFILRDGREVEVFPNMPVEAGEEIIIRTDIRFRRFSIGERLSISASDFDEIAFASYQFAADLARGLPKNVPSR